MDVDVKIRDGVIILTPYGRIIGVGSHELSKEIQAHLQQAGESPRFLFDFREVSRIDSTGIGALIALHVSVAQKGGQVGVINVNPAIRNIFVTARLTTIFERFDNETEAIERIGLRD